MATMGPKLASSSYLRRDPGLMARLNIVSDAIYTSYIDPPLPPEGSENKKLDITLESSKDTILFPSVDQ